MIGYIEGVKHVSDIGHFKDIDLLSFPSIHDAEERRRMVPDRDESPKPMAFPRGFNL